MSDQLTASYKVMVTNAAWKDLEELLVKIHDESNSELDIIHLSSLSVAYAAHARGVRDAIKRIRSHVAYQLGGGPK